MGQAGQSQRLSYLGRRLMPWWQEEELAYKCEGAEPAHHCPRQV